MKETKRRCAQAKNDLVAYRKSCDAEGVGLSHYILLKPEEQRNTQGARA